MSGGPKDAKRPLERPLDGRVRLPRTADEKQAAVRDKTGLASSSVRTDPLPASVLQRLASSNPGRPKQDSQLGRSSVSGGLPESPTGELTANGRAARPDRRRGAFRSKRKVSSPPQDGRPRRLTDRQPHLARRKGPALISTAATTRRDRSDNRARFDLACENRQKPAHHRFGILASRNLTFDMSGGARGAKRPLARPLDGGVRCHCSE